MVQTEITSLDTSQTNLSPHEMDLAPASLSWGAASDKGLVRDENEDAWHIVPELGLFLVSDGMGGHEGGALASRIVAEDLPPMIEARLHKSRSDRPRMIRRIFSTCIIQQSRYLRMEGESESGCREMGATLVLAMLKDRRAYVGNLGDSRIYRYRKGKLVQLTKDHSVIEELIEQGRIDREEADEHDAAGQITHYIGMEEHAEPNVKSFQLKTGDRLLLCTDGLTDMVKEKEISTILGQINDPHGCCKAMIKKANEAGGYDNITAIIVDYKNTR